MCGGVEGRTRLDEHGGAVLTVSQGGLDVSQ